MNGTCFHKRRKERWKKPNSNCWLQVHHTQGFLLPPQNCKIFPIQNPELNCVPCSKYKIRQIPTQHLGSHTKTLLHMLQHSFGHGTQWVANFQIQWTPWLSTLLWSFNSHLGKHYLICAWVLQIVWPARYYLLEMGVVARWKKKKQKLDTNTWKVQEVPT